MGEAAGAAGLAPVNVASTVAPGIGGAPTGAAGDKPGAAGDKPGAAGDIPVAGGMGAPGAGIPGDTGAIVGAVAGGGEAPGRC